MPLGFKNNTRHHPEVGQPKLPFFFKAMSGNGEDVYLERTPGSIIDNTNYMG